MLLFIILMGLILIGSGLLVKAFPNAITGYNTLPEEKKKKVDIRALSTLMRNSLVGMGVLVVLVGFGLIYLGLTSWAFGMVSLIVLAGTVLMVLRAQKFDGNFSTNSPRAIVWTLSIITVLVALLLAAGAQPPKFILDQRNLKITGIYGATIAVAAIQKAELMDQIPPLQMRTNGYAMGSIAKGHFNLDKWGPCILYLQTNHGPYLVLTKRNGERIILNAKDSTQTQSWHNQLESVLNR